jgi:hypothetical protein
MPHLLLDEPRDGDYLSPRAADFFTSIVKPTVDDFLHAGEDVRRGYLAAIVLYHVFDYWTLRKSEDDKKLIRDDLMKRHPDFAIIRDVCDASKHATLTRSSKQLSSSEQIARPPGLFEAPFGIGRFDEATHVVEVTLDDGTILLLSALIRSSFSMWEALLGKDG